MDAVSGRREPSAGSASLRGEPLLGHTPAEIADRGLQRTFQAASVFDGLTVGENLFLAATANELGLRSFLHRSRVVALPAGALKVLAHSGLLDRLDEPVEQLSHGNRKWLELAMVLTRRPDVLLLDEPTAGLTAAERAEVGQLLREEAGNGLAIVVVEHDFGFVRDVADAVTVLHQGRVLAGGSVEEVAADEAVRRVYLGESA
jgi:ABC-type uncharacterized transport system ATPase subunit